MATAMASSHMRMRPQWPMLTTSDTAPMVQKLVLLATAPKTKASAKPPHTHEVRRIDRVVHGRLPRSGFSDAGTAARLGLR